MDANGIMIPDGEFLEQEDEVYFVPGIDLLRLVLMIFFMVGLFGFPSKIGRYVNLIFSFATPAFFILSGYLVLWNEELRGERIVRTIKRTAIAFVALFAAYLVINVIFDAPGTLDVLTSGHFWFNLLVLNKFALPIGTSLWYLLALLYAYIIIWGLNKLKLMRFDWVIMILCFALSMLLGELVGFTGIHMFGCEYIGSNWLTRALPYILLGGLIHRKQDLLAVISPFGYVSAAFAGGIATIAELLLLQHFGALVYYGHLFGMGLLAAAVCTLTVLNNGQGFSSPLFEDIFAGHGTNALYYICEAAYITVNVIMRDAPEVFLQFTGIITVIACLIVVAVLRIMQIRISLKRSFRAKLKRNTCFRQDRGN